jgi:hypothetical protein
MARTEKIVKENRNMYGGNGVCQRSRAEYIPASNPPKHVSLSPGQRWCKEINDQRDWTWRQDRDCLSCGHSWSEALDMICPECGGEYTAARYTENQPKEGEFAEFVDTTVRKIERWGGVNKKYNWGDWLLRILAVTALVAIIVALIWSAVK